MEHGTNQLVYCQWPYLDKKNFWSPSTGSRLMWASIKLLKVLWCPKHRRLSHRRFLWEGNTGKTREIRTEVREKNEIRKEGEAEHLQKWKEGTYVPTRTWTRILSVHGWRISTWASGTGARPDQFSHAVSPLRLCDTSASSQGPPDYIRSHRTVRSPLCILDGQILNF